MFSFPDIIFSEGYFHGRVSWSDSVSQEKNKPSSFLCVLVTSLSEVCHLQLKGNNQVAKLHLASHSESSSLVIYRLQGMKCT